MAQIVLGLGTSHTPMLNCGPEDWPRYLELDTGRSLLDRDGRPTTYADLAAAAGSSMAGHLTPHRMAASHAAVTAAMDRLKETLRAGALDALIVVGDDQKELFHADNQPAILVYRGESIRNVPLRPRPSSPDWYQRASARYYEAEAPRDYPVHAALARHLTDALIDAEFDIASADRLQEGQGEGHAFGFVHLRLMQGLAVPVVPVFLNTYDPPNQPTPRRCYRLGQAIRAAVEAFPGTARVGIIASGGLSHFTIDETLDRAVINALREKDAAALMGLPRHKLNSGSSEIRNWICVAGALEHLALDWVEYVPGYRTPAGTGTGMCFAIWH